MDQNARTNTPAAQAMTLSVDPLYALSGLGVGLLVGMTGVGGGSLMTPILVLLFGVHPTAAVGTDLLFAAATKSVGTYVHGRAGTVAWRMVARLAAGSLPATVVALVLLDRLGPENDTTARLIGVILGVSLLATAIALIFRSALLRWVSRHRPRPEHVAPLTTLLGVALGVLVALSSVGAGALGVTVLIVLYPELPIATIVGSDIAHAVPLTLVGGAGHWLLGDVRWPILGSLLMGSVPGIVAGSLVATRAPERALQLILAATLILVASKLLI